MNSRSPAGYAPKTHCHVLTFSDKLSFYSGINKSVRTETEAVYGANLWLKWQQTRLAQQTDSALPPRPAGKLCGSGLVISADAVSIDIR